MNKIVQFFRLSSQVKIMMLEAAVYSARYRYQILHKPFSEIAPGIGTFQYETEKVKITDQALEDTSWAVHAACKRVQWDSKCLDQALASKKILNKRGYPCTLYMGLRMNEKHEMVAHAWLRCGTSWVSGGDGSGYAITAIYGDKTEKKIREYPISGGNSILEKDMVEENRMSRLKQQMLEVDLCQSLEKERIRSLFFLRPNAKDKHHMLVHEADMDQAIQILLSKGFQEIENEEPDTRQYRRSEVDVILYVKIPSDYSDRFNAFWNRRDTLEMPFGKLYCLGQWDQMGYWISLLGNPSEETPAMKCVLRNMYKDNEDSLEMLYNHMKARGVQASFLKILINLYCTEVDYLKEYQGSFLSVQRKDDKITVTYDPLLDKDFTAFS